MRRAGLLTLIATAALPGLPILPGCQGACLDPDGWVSFRQHEIENEADAARNGEVVFSGAWVGPDDKMREDEAWRMLAWIVRAIPGEPIVYPSEGYYYFRAARDGRFFSGNLRVIEGDRPVLSFAYFDTASPREYRSLVIDPATDERVHIVPRRDGEYTVTILGHEFLWRQDISKRAFDQSIPLLITETPIAGVFDESGVQFHLVFNRDTAYFHYLLPRGTVVEPRWTEVRATDTGRVMLDARTGFLAYHDPRVDRWTLIGVAADEIRKNSYHDGPFDQVPPGLRIGGMLRRAYPYVNHGGGIDEHGGFIDQPSVRVAISPYMQYESVEQALLMVDTCERGSGQDPATLLSRLCYESKRSFDPDSPDTAAVSRPWPANHFGTVSRAWPTDHEPRLSGSWPANQPAPSGVAPSEGFAPTPGQH